MAPLRVVLVKGVSRYGATRLFVDSLAAAFRRRGDEVVFIDVGGDASAAELASAASQPVDLVYSVGILGDWRDGAGRSLGQVLGGPHVMHVVDYPLVHYERLANTDPSTALLFVDRGHVEAARSIYGPDRFAHLGFCPIGACGELTPVPADPSAFAAERPVGVLFPGTYQAPSRTDWDVFPAGFRTLMDRALDIQLTDEAISVLAAFDVAMRDFSLDPAEPEFRDVRRSASVVNEYVRQHRRIQFLEAAAKIGLPLHVLGEGYGEHLARLTNIDWGGQADLNTVLAAMRRSRIVVNVNVNFRDGSQERPFNTGLAGAAIASDRSRYLAEAFEGGGSIQFFHWSNLEADLAEVGRLAEDPERSWRIARAGQKRVMAAHLWDHRIAAILEAAETARG